jgi:hypothetical protein
MSRLMAIRIVIYGVDEILLHTRQAILSNAGVASIATSEIGEVIESLQTYDPVLLILCSSVEEKRLSEGVQQASRIRFHRSRLLLG